LAKVAKLQIRKEWLRGIWESFVRYANVNDDQSNRGRTSTQKVRAFQEVLIHCMNWIGGESEDIAACMDMKDGARLADLEVRHRAEIKRVLAWLTAPERYRELAVKAVDFLGRYGNGVRLHICENSSFKAGSDEPIITQWPDSCESVVSPVCRFILDQIELHDSEGVELNDVVPVGRCSRAGCDQFFVVERAGRGRFCSDKCRARNYQDGLTKEEKAARMSKYRATIKEMRGETNTLSEEEIVGLSAHGTMASLFLAIQLFGLYLVLRLGVGPTSSTFQ
jgi:hypothetical protein